MAETFPKSAPKEAKSKVVPGDLGGYNLKNHDPSTDQLAKNLEVNVHDDPAGNGDDVRKGARVKKALEDAKNARLRSKGEDAYDFGQSKKYKRGLQGDLGVTPVRQEGYEGFKKVEKEVAHEKGVNDPAAVAAAIGRKKYGKNKFQAAAAAHEKLGEAETTVCPKCAEPVPCEYEPKGKKLLLGADKKLKEETLANKIALSFLEGAKAEKEERIDEISKKLAGSYIVNANYAHGQKQRDIAYKNSGDEQYQNTKEYENDTRKRRNLQKGIFTAVNKLTGDSSVNAKEEVEPIEEISKDKLVDYERKAAKDFLDPHGLDKPGYKEKKEKRLRSITLAAKKISMEETTPAGLSPSQYADHIVKKAEKIREKQKKDPNRKPAWYDNSNLHPDKKTS